MLLKSAMHVSLSSCGSLNEHMIDGIRRLIAWLDYVVLIGQANQRVNQVFLSDASEREQFRSRNR